MTEDKKLEVAVFRFGVISDFVNGNQLSRGERGRLFREKCSRKWVIPHSEKTRIDKGTIQRWIRIYNKNNGNLEDLCPKERSDKGKPRAMDDDTCLSLSQLRLEFPGATIDYLIDQMHLRNLVTPGITLAPTTVYRYLHQQNMMNLTRPAAQDRRKFEAELPNDLWQSDVMHGPRVMVDGKRRKTYLIAIIDDHSRLMVHGIFYLSEALASYLDALKSALLRRGLPRKLYVDNGPAFRSKHLEYITASLNIALIHAKPYSPQGKGKIERWFKTVRSSFLPTFKGNTLEELNEALDHWINETYHQRKHSSTGQTPFDRFTSNMQCLRMAPENLKDYFRIVARRKVGKDRSVTLNGRLYEAPVALIGKRVELLYHTSELDRIEIKYNNKSYGYITQIDLHVNCRIKRDKNNNPDMHIESDESHYKGGALLAVKEGE